MTDSAQTNVAGGPASTQVLETPAIRQILDVVHSPDDEVNREMGDAIITILRVCNDRHTKGKPLEKLDKRAVDLMIAEYDAKLSAQIDCILHHPDFQAIESSWRGLKLLIDRTDFRENIEIDLLNASKDDLVEDFEDATEIKESGLYKHVFTAEFGQFGGSPYGAVIGNLEFGPRARDMKLLQNVAAVAAMSHCPFVAAASPQFFGKNSYLGLPAIKDLKGIFDGPAFTKWQAFREDEDSRWVGLTAPRFLLRLPYSPDDNPVKGFNYEETVSDNHESYLWGNTAFTFATTVTASFAKYRWCANIIGPSAGGAIHDLPVHVYQNGGRDQTKIPTEVLIPNELEKSLADAGFIALTMRKNSDNACFFGANSCQMPKTFGTSKAGKEAELNAKLGAQLPYLFVVSRLAHYIKAIQTENLGRAMTAVQLQQELDTWIQQYVLDQDVAAAEVFAKRPLRQASISVEDIPGEPGWYKVALKVRPHFKYIGAFFELSLVGKLKQNDRDN